jgi:hypothetical protein
MTRGPDPNTSTASRLWATLAAAALVLVLATGAAGPDEPAKAKAKPQSKSGAKAAAEPPPPLNVKVLEFAREHTGQKVGDGLCTSLAIAALRDAGARSFPTGLADGNFIWGQPVDSFREALPGDVVQFRDAVYQGKAWVTKRRWVTWHLEYPHHTAILAEVREGGKVVVFLHQNVGPDGATHDEKQIVSETTVRADSLQKGGRIWIYRPVARDDPSFRPDPGPTPRGRPGG